MDLIPIFSFTDYKRVKIMLTTTDFAAAFTRKDFDLRSTIDALAPPGAGDGNERAATRHHKHPGRSCFYGEEECCVTGRHRARIR